MWRILLEKNSASDVGTLYQAKNFLNAVNMPLNPMDDPDASYDLLASFTDALVLSCYETVKTQLPQLPCLPIEQEAIKEQLLNGIVDNFALPKIPDFGSASGYNCQHCSKSYKRAKSLRNHIQSKHNTPGLTRKESSDNDDSIYNYSRNALALGLLAKDFVDARKHGDGLRIIRLYKVLLLFFKLEARHKYSFYSLFTLAQVHYLLPPKLAYELVWNRTNNTQGKIDSNVENDRTVEHHVKTFKMDCKDFQGKVSSKSIQRASHSYNQMNKVMDSFDKAASLKKPSGRHSKPDISNDIRDLSRQFVAKKIFEYIPGREHQAFPGFKKNVLEQIDTVAVSKWMKEKLKEFQSMKVFNQFQEPLIDH